MITHVLCTHDAPIVLMTLLIRSRGLIEYYTDSSNNFVLRIGISYDGDKNSSDHRSSGTKDDTMRVPVIVGDEGSSDGRANETGETDDEGRLSNVRANLYPIS